MAAPKSRELLFRLLQGDAPSPAALLGLVRAFEAQQELEGQWFDLKSGALLRDTHGKEKLRAAISGFANAEGGFLLIGYNENAETFDHVAPVGKQQPEQWVTDALGSIAHTIAPPRFATVEVGGGPVLLVAIERARSLVYVIEDGLPVHYLRFGHQTKPMPPSLVTDLMLGRKTRPELRVTDVHVIIVQLINYDSHRVYGLDVALRVAYENDALALGELVRCGLVGWSVAPVSRALPQQLRRSIDFEEPPTDLAFGGYPWAAWGAQHYRSLPAEYVEPFAPAEGDLPQWRIPVFRPIRIQPPRPPEPPQHPPEVQAQAFGALEIKAAFYLLAKNAEPSWWQLTMRYSENAAGQLTERAEHHIRFEPCPYSRPVVSLRFLDEGEPVEFPEP